LLSFSRFFLLFSFFSRTEHKFWNSEL
jgi:hypothetical protein